MTLLTLGSCFPPPHYCRARQFAQRICADPLAVASFEPASRLAVATAAELKRAIAFTGCTQRHVHGLPDEVSLIAGFAFNEGKALR